MSFIANQLVKQTKTDKILANHLLKTCRSQDIRFRALWSITLHGHDNAARLRSWQTILVPGPLPRVECQTIVLAQLVFAACCACEIPLECHASFFSRPALALGEVKFSRSSCVCSGIDITDHSIRVGFPICNKPCRCRNVEPLIGIEPMTYSLPWSCSTN
jgi:hypothetical protein